MDILNLTGKELTLTPMIGKKAEPYLLLLPAVALALMFSILPFMRTVFLSFMKVTQGGDVIGFGGLSSYKSLFADKAFIRSIGHTLLFVLLFIPLNTALTLLAAVLTRRKGRRTGIAEFIFFSPMAISLSAYGMIFSEMFRGRISIANRILGMDILWLESPISAMAVLVFLCVFLDFGLDYILLLSAFRSIDRSLMEAAEIDGCGSVRTLLWIELPAIRNMLLVTVFLALKDALLISAPIMILTEGGPYRSTETVMYYYYLEAFRSSNLQKGRTISTLMALVSMSLVALTARRKRDE